MLDAAAAAAGNNLLEEDISIGPGLMVPFCSISWEQVFGQPPAGTAGVQGKP